MEYKINNYCSSFVVLREGEDRYTVCMAIHPVVAGYKSVEYIFDLFIKVYYKKGEIGSYYSNIYYREKYENYKKSQKFNDDIIYWASSIKDRKFELECFGKDDFIQKGGLVSSINYTEWEKIVAGYTDSQWNKILTFEMFCLLGIVLVLRWYSGENTIIIDLIHRNTFDKTDEQCIGNFHNILPMVINADGSDTVRTLAGKIQKKVSQNNYHAQCNMLNVMKKLSGRKDRSITNILFDTRRNDGLVCSPDVTLDGTYKELMEEHEVGFYLDSSNNNILTVDMCGFFSERFANELSKDIGYALAVIAGKKRDRIKDITLMNKDSYHKVIYNFNANKMKYDLDRHIIDVFITQVKKNEDKIAIIDGVNKYSFNELYSLAIHYGNVINSYKKDNSDFKVVVIIDKSIDLIVSVLATQIANSTYVPVDPEYPSERIAYIVENSEAGLVLFNQDSENIVKSTGIIPTLKINAKGKLDSIDKVNILETSLTKGDRDVYIIYTSGTTGTPKGVVIQQHSLLNFINCMSEVCHDARVCTMSSSVAFDGSVFDVWLPLLTGKSCVILKKYEVSDPAILEEKINSHHIDFGFFTTALFNALYGSKPEMFTSFKYICFGGEKANENITKTAAIELQNVTLINIYGPAECTIGATYFKLTVKNVNKYNTISVGRPVKNCSVYVLNSELKPMPYGKVGQIFISGQGLSRGYHKLPKLTDKLFAHNPFFGENNISSATEIMYASGDQGYYDESGDLYCFGRIDNQVKVLGHRIELDSINSTLSSISGVNKSAVNPDQSGDDIKIIAFVESTLNPDVLLSILQDKLPGYMIPSSVIIVDKISMTINGKVDHRKLLKDYHDGRQDSGQELLGLEYDVASYFSTILNIPIKKIGRKDDFFNLGGHSLHAVQLIDAIAKGLNKNISVPVFFYLRTIQNIAAYLDTLSCGYSKDMMMKIEKSPVDYHKLSYAEGRLWFLHNYEDPLSYTISECVKLKGFIDKNLLEKALNVLARRQKILNSYYSEADGDIVRMYDQHYYHSIYYIDASHYDLVKKNSTVNQQVGKSASHIFYLEKLPLVVMTLIKLSDDAYYLVYSFHHIIFDGYSAGIFMDELGAIYKRLNNGLPYELDVLAIDYAGFAYSHNKWVNGDASAKQFDFWKNKLAYVSNLMLPYDFKKASESSGPAEQVVITIKGDLYHSIKRYIAQNKVTLYSFLMSVYAILLSKYTAQKDVTIGTLMANRQGAEVKKIIGYFVNTVFVTSSVYSLMRVLEFVKCNNKEIISVSDNQDIPFDRIVEEFGSSDPLFKTLFTLQAGVKLSGSWDDVSWELEFTKSIKSKFDLLVISYDKLDSLNFVFEYNTDLFLDEKICEMADAYIALINQIMSHEHATISDLVLLNPPAIAALIEEQKIVYNYPEGDDVSILHLFERMCAQYPDKVAVKDSESEITFSALDVASTALAQSICNFYAHKNIGSTVDSFISIFIGKSIQYIVSILAILKVGAAYIPLDVKHPSSRIEFILQDSSSSLILSTLEYAKKLSCVDVILMIDDLPLCVTEYDLRYLKPSKHSIIYIIYTSGTTGKPKGVLVNHKNVIRLFASAYAFFQFTPTDVWTAFHSFAFDYTVWEIWGSLIHGSMLVIIDDATVQDIPKFYTLVSEEKVTIMSQTPAVFSNIIAGDEHYHLPLSLRCVVLAGENLIFESLEPWFRLHNDKDIVLLNLYGVTEATVVSTIYQIKASDINSTHYSIIGRGFPDVSLYVLDNDRNLLPNSVIGELYISGEGVAEGYYNRESLSFDRFIANPFSSDPDSLLYKTGDLVIRRPDGNLLYIGRNDNQVKIRGYRIELGEIENVAAKSPIISQVCVIILNEEKKGDALVMYVIITTDDAINLGEFNDFLADHLPVYMIPDHIVPLRSFPLTPNGKVDKLKLPLPSSSVDVKRVRVAPKTEFEKALVSLWASLLGVSESSIGIEDNFFEIGGHSLLVAKMLMQLNSKFNITVNFMKFLENPVILTLTGSETVSVSSSLLKRIESDMFLPDDIRYISNLLAADTVNPKVILLTGATGYLGVYLLSAMLSAYSATVICIVRAHSNEQALQRLKETAGKFHLLDAIDWQRVEAVVGDISKDKFGIASEGWADLSQTVDVIFHCGAFVHHIYDYNKLRDANVLSTLTLLKLACTGKNKSFNYISTISSASVLDEAGNMLEVGPTYDVKEFNQFNGYMLTKYLSEVLTWRAKDKGICATIFRPGNIAADTLNGRCDPETNHSLLLLKSCIQLGCAPRWDFQYDFFPVNHIADIIAKAAINSHKLSCPVYNLSNSQSPYWLTIVEWINEQGYSVDLISPEAWVNKIKHIGPENALFPLVGFYVNTTDHMQGSEMFHTDNLKALAEVSEIGDLKISYEQFSTMCTYLRESEFFP